MSGNNSESARVGGWVGGGWGAGGAEVPTISAAATQPPRVGSVTTATPNPIPSPAAAEHKVTHTQNTEQIRYASIQTLQSPREGGLKDEKEHLLKPPLDRSHTHRAKPRTDSGTQILQGPIAREEGLNHEDECEIVLL